MEYKRFTVKAFEREPEKWRASVQRTNGRPLWAGRAKIRHFVTGIDATTPQRAVQMALAATDRGAFARELVEVMDAKCAPPLRSNAASPGTLLRQSLKQLLRPNSSVA